MVAKAKEELEQEMLIKEEEKQKYLAERAPPLNISSLNLQQLQVTGPTIPLILPHPSHFFITPTLASQYSKTLVKELHLSFYCRQLSTSFVSNRIFL